MSIDDLITDTLDVIRSQFYPDHAREFKRDERALLKAIARWGHECATRGWDFDAAFIQRHFLDLLNDIKQRGAEIKYLPIYLEGAVGRWIGQRAEDYRDLAYKSTIKSAVTKAVRGVRRVEAVREKSDTEILDRLYRDLRKKATARRRGRQGAKVRQEELSL